MNIVKPIVAATVILISNVVLANPWTDYYIRINKTSVESSTGATLYKISLETSDGLAIAPEGGLVSALDKISKAYATQGIASDLCSNKLSAEARESQTLAISLSDERPTDPQQLFISCFQYWYLNLSPINRIDVLAFLSHTGEDNQAILAAHATDFNRVISNNFKECSSAYPDFVLTDQNGGFTIYQGLTKWYEGLPLQDEYINFKYLLDPVKSNFDQMYQQSGQPSTECKDSLLKNWLSATALKANSARVFSDLPAILYERSTTNNRSLLAFDALAQWSSRDELEAFRNTGKASASLQETLIATDNLLSSCFPIVNGKATYYCDTGEKAATRLARLTCDSKFAEKPFSFLAPKQ